ncbi:MAG: hypothetical protein NVS9B12_14850 [Vulcanimicrobiaceae bacterium]
MWRVVGALDWRPIARSIAGVSGSALFMVFGLRWLGLLEPAAASGFGRSEFLLGQMFIGAIIFFGILRIIDNEELRLVVELVAEKLRRSLPSAPENRESPIA